MLLKQSCWWLWVDHPFFHYMIPHLVYLEKKKTGCWILWSFLRIILAGLMVTSSMWATQTMKLQLSSLQKWWLRWMSHWFFWCNINLNLDLYGFYILMTSFHYSGLCKGEWGTFFGGTNCWCKLQRILWWRIWWQWQENSRHDHNQ